MNQIQPPQLGFKNLLKVVPAILTIGPLVSLRLSGSSVVSKRNVSTSSKPVSAMAEDKTKDKRLKALMGTKPYHVKPLVKESGVESCSVGIASFKDNPKIIEKMTVQELRTTLRSIGLPARGRKPELISALKLFVEKKINGESSQTEEAQVFSFSTESVSVEREAESLHEKDEVEMVSSLWRFVSVREVREV